MEAAKEKSMVATALPYACILAVITCITTLICYLAGLSYFWGGAVANLIKAIVFLIVFIIVMSNWKKKKTIITYKAAFVFGLLVIGLYVAIMLVFDFCFYQFIAPDFYVELRNHTLQMMIDYNLPEAQIDETDAQFEKGMENATALGMSLNMALTRLIADIIILLIVAIFIRKKALPEQSVAQTNIS